MRLSLRYQLLFPILVLILGVAGLGAWSAVRSVQYAVRRQIEVQLGHVARTVSEASFPFTERVLAQLKDLTGADYVFVGADGKKLATLDLPVEAAMPVVPSDEWPALRLETNVLLAGQNYLAAQVHLRRAEPSSPDSLFIFYPEWRWREALWSALWPALVSGLAGGLLSIGLAISVAHWLTWRVRMLEQQTRAIAAGDFQPLPEPGWDDELRDLAVSISRMAGQLALWRDAVQKTERLRLLAQVSGGLAHQLRNSVTGARLAVQVHTRSCPAPGDVLDVALRQLALMEEKVQRLLQAGREQLLARVPCALVPVLDEAIALMRPQCEHRHIDLRWLPPAGEPQVLGDAGQLGHLFVNLLGNAAEAIGADGSIEVCVRAGAEPTGREIEGLAGRAYHVVEIVDSGPGPPPEVAARIFEEFVTSKPEGVGLGLAVARQVALCMTAASNGNVRARGRFSASGCRCYNATIHA